MFDRTLYCSFSTFVFVYSGILIVIFAISIVIIGIFATVIALGFVNHSTLFKGPSHMNFLVIMTDDQRYDTLRYMPTVQDELIKKGTLFSNSFVTTPLCCPSRASFLSGGFYPFNTGVLFNELPNGGAARFSDSDTLAVALQQNGYTTGLIGKYLNGYSGKEPRIPPGWSTFEAVTNSQNWTNFETVTGSSALDSDMGNVRENNYTYITYYERDRAIDFIEKNSQKPFFLYLAFDAPHSPATPASEDRDAFANFTYASPGTQESNLDDKPPWVKIQSEKKVAMDKNNTDPEADNFNTVPFERDQLRSLQSVDRSVAAIIRELEQKGVLDNTVLIYTSDNGMMWGEHGGLLGKMVPYEESIRVPLVIRMPDIQQKFITNLVAMNLDVPATIFNLAGVHHKTDGLDLYPLMKGENPHWRDYIVFQSFAFNGIGSPLSWTALRTEDWKYTKYQTGTSELYDLAHDPYELKNQYNNPAYSEQIKQYSNLMEPLTGLNIVTRDLPIAKMNTPYSFTLSAWGGTKPYLWKTYAGNMPDGLHLGSDGRITGTPISMEGFGKEFQIQVTDSSTSPQSGKHQSYVARFSIRLQ